MTGPGDFVDRIDRYVTEKSVLSSELAALGDRFDELEEGTPEAEALNRLDYALYERDADLDDSMQRDLTDNLPDLARAIAIPRVQDAVVRLLEAIPEWRRTALIEGFARYAVPSAMTRLLLGNVQTLDWRATEVLVGLLWTSGLSRHCEDLEAVVTRIRAHGDDAGPSVAASTFQPLYARLSEGCGASRVPDALVEFALREDGEMASWVADALLRLELPRPDLIQAARDLLLSGPARSRVAGLRLVRRGALVELRHEVLRDEMLRDERTVVTHSGCFGSSMPVAGYVFDAISEVFPEDEDEALRVLEQAESDRD